MKTFKAKEHRVQERRSGCKATASFLGRAVQLLAQSKYAHSFIYAEDLRNVCGPIQRLKT